MTERQLQSAVIEAARLSGWLVAHFRPARTDRGWRTPVEADAAGFPDVVLCRERVVFAELKGERTRVTREQRAWIEALVAAGAEAYVWRPGDWAQVEHVLGTRQAERLTLTEPVVEWPA